MFARVIRKFKLFLNPVKKGDTFYGDPVWFILFRPTEMVLHNLKDRNGVTMFNPIPSRGCFRFVVEQCGNENLILGSQVFCKEKTDNNIGTWMKRTQPRRMGKEIFEELFLAGMLWREK